MIVLGDSYKEFGLERDEVVEVCRDFVQPPKAPDKPRDKPLEPYTGPQVWHQTQKKVDEVLKTSQRDRFKSYCFQYLVGKEPISALRYVGKELEEEVAKEISKKSNSLRQELYAQYLVDRVTLAIHALRHLVKEEDLTEQLGDIFRWRSGLLDDIWTDDGETMCLQPLLLLSSTHVRQDLNLTIDQIKQCSALNNKWKKIQRNNEGEDFQRQTELTHELVDDIKTNFLTEEQRERYGQLVKQRFLLADDLLTTVRLLKLEIPKEKREAFNAEMMNFHLCIGAIQHLRRYSMRFPLIEDHLDAKKLSALTRYQFIPCGSFGGKPKLPEAFSDLVAAKPKPINPRRQRR